MSNKTSTTNFKEINSPQDLIAYLSDNANRLDNIKNGSIQYVYHYTKLSNVVSIIKSGYWWLKSPKTMNDGLEFQHISELKQNKAVFFASFVYDSSESIAMWSMYAQPWEDGVFIRIPVAIFKKWIRYTTTIYTVHSHKNTSSTIEKSLIPVENLSIVRVAYTNSDSAQNKSEEKLICGSAENDLLKDTPHLLDLVGYIKDMAWKYENEVRVLVSADKNIKCDGLAIKLSDDLINSMEIVAGPRFSGSLSKKIMKEVHQQFIVKQSLFSNKLKWIPCDDCPEKSKCKECTKSYIF